MNHPPLPATTSIPVAAEEGSPDTKCLKGSSVFYFLFLVIETNGSVEGTGMEAPGWREGWRRLGEGPLCSGVCSLGKRTYHPSQGSWGPPHHWSRELAPPLASFPDPRKEAGAGLRKKPKALWAGLMVRVTMFPCAFPLPRSVTPGRPALLSGPGSLWL